ALKYLRRKPPVRQEIRRARGYFRTNRARMRYADLKARGLPIGSGVVEAACKTLVTQRMKNRGMRWTTAGAQAVLTPRGWDQSDRFDEAWALVAATSDSKVVGSKSCGRAHPSDVAVRAQPGILRGRDAQERGRAHGPPVGPPGLPRSAGRAGRPAAGRLRPARDHRSKRLVRTRRCVGPACERRAGGAAGRGAGGV